MNTDIHDIKGLVPLPTGWWWLWALAALVVVAIAIWLLRRRLRKRQALQEITARPSLSACEIALQSLRQLRDDQRMERGQVEEFYTRLSDIVRHYLEGQFQLRAPERTTEEFLQEVTQTLAPSSLSREHKDLLGAFLQESDLVKFARSRPGVDDMKRAFDAAERFVRDTGSPSREEVGLEK